MCSRVTCRRCGKATWSGCGSHVEQVMAGVPKAQRCECPPPEPGGLFKKLFGRA